MASLSMAGPSTSARIALREPLGEREWHAPLTVGGEGSDVVVPGEAIAGALRIERDPSDWRISAHDDAVVRLNGERLRAPRELHRGDVLHVGDADVVVRDVDAERLELDVHHLAGNETVAPLAPQLVRTEEDEDEDVEILASRNSLAAARASGERGDPPRRGRRMAWVAAAAIFVALAGSLFALQRVSIDIRPAEAKVAATGTFVSWHSGDTVFVWPGRHTLRATAEGYAPAEQQVAVTMNESASARFRLLKLPGVLVIDSHGVAAKVAVDGAQAGEAPGEVSAPAGSRTLTLRAPRHLDAVIKVDVEGLGKRQPVDVTLQPSWGALSVSATSPGANVTIDDGAPVATPAKLDLPAGVHRVRVSALDAKTWESAVVVKAGETLVIGPLELGAPDATYVVRSNPSGADVTVDGRHRGRTPVEVALAPSANHDVLIARTGYASWSRTVSAAAGSRTVLDARLEPILVPLVVRGQPSDAQILVDGVVRGTGAQTLSLNSGEHAIEIRKEGLAPYTAKVVMAPGIARTLEYTLTPPGRPSGALAQGKVLRVQSGYGLVLVQPATFDMGSDRREQGRRPNEGRRRVTLTRAYYIGLTEVTNAQFRRFRGGHDSGFVEKSTIDLDAQPVTRVSWNDAVEFCNWLSSTEGLPAAYVRSGNSFALVTPINNGYRLPSEAEWEYAARYAGPQSLRRYVWGDALPIPAGVGNIAGIEARGTMDAVLDGYDDKYPVVAPVGTFAATALGLFDIGGNVSEWTHDSYASFVDGSPLSDPFGPAQSTKHVIRGPNWRTSTTADLRLAWRDGSAEVSQTIGFRIARYADP